MPIEDFDLIQDIPLNLVAEYGRTQLTVREVLEFKKGYVIEVQKLAGEPIDLVMQGVPIAKGEVIIHNENFAIRLTDIIEKNSRFT